MFGQCLLLLVCVGICLQVFAYVRYVCCSGGVCLLLLDVFGVVG